MRTFTKNEGSQQTFLSLLRGHNSYFRYQSIVSLVLLRGHNSYHAYWVVSRTVLTGEIATNGQIHKQYTKYMDSLLTYGSALIHLQLVNNDCYYLHICTIWTGHYKLTLNKSKG